MKGRGGLYISLLIACAMILFGNLWRYDVSNRSIEFDQGLFLYVADRIDSGQAQYTDDFDNMPPGIYYLYILGFKVFGNDPVATHLVTAVSDTLVAALIILLGYLLGGPLVGLYSGALYSFCYVMIRWAPKGSTENPMMALILATLILYAVAVFRQPKKRDIFLLGAGMFWAGACMIKQPAVFLGLTFFLDRAVAVRKNQRPWSMALIDLLWIGAGFSILLLGVGIWLGAQGLLHKAIYNAFLFPFSMQRDYGMLFGERWAEFLDRGFWMMPALFALGLAGLVYGLVKYAPKRFLAVAYCLPVFLYLLWTGDFFQHYLIQLVPGLCLCAGFLFAFAAKQGKAKWPLRIALALIFTVFVYGNYTRIDQATIRNVPQEERSKIFETQWLRTHRDEQLDYQRMVGRYLRHYLKPGDRLVTSTPTYAYLAGVKNSYSQYYLAPLTKAASEDFKGLDEALNAAKFFVVEGWRTPLLPFEVYEKVRTEWKQITWLSEDGSMDLLVWENPAYSD